MLHLPTLRLAVVLWALSTSIAMGCSDPTPTADVHGADGASSDVDDGPSDTMDAMRIRPM